MAVIHELPEHVANQIAAGEVVEGPASIIKELCENSVDAGAKHIEIIISKNFLKLEIIDNGCGMSPEDLPLAFKKHATSKIKNIEDLYDLNTNGFRGEALASIAAVSKLSCITKRDEDKHATKIYLENGNTKISQVGAQTGTSICIDDLFFNTPARLKFLKSDSKLRNQCIDTTRALAFAKPELKISLNIDGKNILDTSGSNQLDKLICEIFSSKLEKELIAVNMQRQDYKISGFISKNSFYRSDKRGIFSFLNGRVVSCYILRSAIESVYKEIVPPGKSPIAVINLEIPKSEVDINVHPSKKEVKYQNTNQIYNFVGDAISKALADDLYENTKSFQTDLKSFSYHQPPGATNEYQLSQESITMPEPVISTESQEDFSDSIEIVSQKKFISRFGSVDINLCQEEEREFDTSLGNKSTFKLVVRNADQGKQVSLRGDYLGPNWLKEKYMQFLQSVGEEILEREESLDMNPASRSQNLSNSSSRPQAKPSKTMLEKIWQRDHYTCVYCGKLLLHPDTVKNNLSTSNDPEKLNDHLASYDHHLPASKYPILNEDERNLHACCRACNIQKSNSLASKTWEPQAQNGWHEAKLEIGTTVFTKPL